MTASEDERRKYLALQAFYLKVKESMEELEERLGKPLEISQADDLEN